MPRLTRKLTTRLTTKLPRGLSSSAGAPGPSLVTAPSLSPAGPVASGTLLTVGQGSYAGTAPITLTTLGIYRDGVLIAGTAGATDYTTVPADEGHALTVKVEASNPDGARTFTSAPVYVLGLPVNTTPPSILPATTPQLEGSVLTYQPGIWSGAVVVTHEWMDDGVGTGDSGATFSTTGHTGNITVRETGTNVAGSDTADSAAVNIVPDVVETSPAVLAGDFEIDGVVTVTPGTYANEGALPRQYRWYLHGGLITALNDLTSVTLSHANGASAGDEVTCVENVSRLDGTYKQYVAQPQDVVIVPEVTQAPVVSPTGPVDVGDTLTVTNPGSFAGADSIGRHWEHVSNPGVVVAGVGNYTTQPTDAGETMVYVATGTNGGGSTVAESNQVDVNVDDFRLTVPSPQWSFRRAAAGEGDGGAADNNCVLGDGGTACVQMVDLIPQASKAVSEAEYIIDALSASQRPGLGGNGQLVYTASESDGMVKDPSPLVQSMASRNEMSVYFVWAPDGANQGAFAFSQSASLYWSAWGVSVDAVNCLCRRSATGPNGARAASAGAYTVDCVTFNATTATFYSDGAPVVTAAVSTLPTSPTRLALGLLSRSGAELQYFLNGGYAEQFGAFAEHDATTVAAVTASLKTYWTARGLTIP